MAWDWEALIDAHGDRAYSFALGLAGNEDDARELVQEAFAKAMDRADQHDPSQPFEAWFLTILKNIFLDGVRRSERRYGQSLDAPVGPGGLTVADAVADGRERPLIERLERREDARLVRKAMKALSPELRATLLLVDMEERTYEDAAAVLGCPLNTVRSRVFRARAALRETLLALEVTP